MPASYSTTPFIDYLLQLADNSLILGHRNSEWTGHGPILEQDIALSNIALDLIGQARNFYQYAATLINQVNEQTHINEDHLAYLRNERDFKNLLLAEQENGDWGKTIMRQFLFSSFQYPLYAALQQSADEQLSAIAAKSLKEVTYHLRWSSEWVIRLGDGTDVSNKRMQQALEALWLFTGEMFSPVDYEKTITEQEGISLKEIETAWLNKVSAIFSEANLLMPRNVIMRAGGKNGIHGRELENLLNEMQQLQRTYPDCEW